MRLPRNNWSVLAVAVGGWLLSWLFVLGAGDVPDWLFWLWVGFKAAVPILAAFVMYRISLREADRRGRSVVAVHFTYILILLLFAPLSVNGFAFLLTKPEAPGGALQDVICILQLMIGAVIFWFIRGGEFLLKAVFPPRKAEQGAAGNSRPPSPLSASPEVQSSDSLRTPSSGGCA